MNRGVYSSRDCLKGRKSSLGEIKWVKRDYREIKKKNNNGKGTGKEKSGEEN